MKLHSDWYISSRVIPKMRPSVKYMLGFTAACTTSGVFMLALYKIKEIRESEYTLHAVMYSVDVIDRHLHKTGRWPTSWEDLEQNLSRSPDDVYSLPEDTAELQRRVHVDFNYNAKDLEHAVISDFRAVKPIGRTYPSYQIAIQRFLDEHRHVQ